jgi:DNA-binding phage protein
MSQEDIIARLREKFAVLEAVLDERGRRLWAVTEARALGHGGQTLVAQATGLSRRTIYQGLQELDPSLTVPRYMSF